MNILPFSRLILGALVMTVPLAAHPARAQAAELLAEFPEAAKERPWVVVNDNVMGGRSDGAYELTNDALVFAGRTNTNGGGFSSIRSQPRSLDLGAFDGIRLRVRGDGRTYILRLTTSVTRGGRLQPSYWASFATEADAWTTVDVPFSALRPRWRGRWLEGPAFEPTKIETLGLMIYDRLDGPFRLEVDRLEAYRAVKPFTMRDYRWDKRPLLLFAPSDADARLQRQLAAVRSSIGAFEDRDMVLIVVVGEGTSRAGERALPTDVAARLRRTYAVEPKAFALRLVGKDGGVKRTSADTVPMKAIYDQIDAMPMRRAEMREADDAGDR